MKVRCNFTLTPSTINLIQEVSKLKGDSMSDLVADAIEITYRDKLSSALAKHRQLADEITELSQYIEKLDPGRKIRDRESARRAATLADEAVE